MGGAEPARTCRYAVLSAAAIPVWACGSDDRVNGERCGNHAGRSVQAGLPSRTPGQPAKRNSRGLARGGKSPLRACAELASITGELAAGRPVLVLQNLGVSWAPRWHYAVVVGADADSDQNRSSFRHRRTTSNAYTCVSAHLETQRLLGANDAEPGDLPADPDRDRYVEAVAGLEQTGHDLAARDAWQAGLSQWPDDAVVIFGLANAHYALGSFSAAEALFLVMLRNDDASVIARNNLAMTLAAQGRQRRGACSRSMPR